jgi:hypothetical protein
MDQKLFLRTWQPLSQSRNFSRFIKPEVHYRFRKILPLILSHIYPSFNRVLPSTLTFSNDLFLQAFQLLLFSMLCYVPPISLSLLWAPKYVSWIAIILELRFLRLLWYHSPFQALTAFTMPRHLFRPAGIASGFLTFRFFPGIGLLAPRPTPNLEDQVSEFISPGDRVAQLYPWTLGSSGT